MSVKPNSLHPEWLDALKNPATYPHPVSQVQTTETHISWVALTGDWAYKLKKPVKFDFVDFSTLDLRRAACNEELRLNRRTAPELYDDVVALTAESSGPRFGGSGPVLDFAVRMHQFAQEDLLDQRLARGDVSFDAIEVLAREVARLHLGAAVASIESPFGTSDSIDKSVRECLDDLTQNSHVDSLQMQLDQLNEWIAGQWYRLKHTFAERKRQGCIRECHGDLHLGNLVFYAGRPMLFDCLEFNPQFRWIDIICDMAFLVMDLHDRGASPLAWRALNEWLQQTGDYGGLQTLRYYLVYRSLVRAKVASLRLRQPELSQAESQLHHKLLISYVNLATTVTRVPATAIILMHGVSGSGKSVVARRLASSLGAVQIRSDVERKRLFGRWPSMERVPVDESEMYSTEATRKTYMRLQVLTRHVVAAGYSVIVDAAFLRRSDRQDFVSLSNDLKAPVVIVTCNAPESVLRERVLQRQSGGQDASDADVTVLERQLATLEQLELAELHSAVSVDTTNDDLESTVRAIQAIANEIQPTPPRD